MEHEAGVVDGQLGVALVVGRDVAQVADVPVLHLEAGVRVAGRVVVAARGHAVLGPDAVLVDVEAVLAGRQAAEHGVDRVLAPLVAERDPALDLAVLGRDQDRHRLLDRLRLLLLRVLGRRGPEPKQAGDGRPAHCKYGRGSGNRHVAVSLVGDSFVEGSPEALPHAG